MFGKLSLEEFMDLCDRKDNAANELNMQAMTPEVSLKTDRHTRRGAFT